MDAVITELDIFLETYYPYMGFERTTEGFPTVRYYEDGGFAKINKVRIFLYDYTHLSGIKVEVYINKPTENVFLFQRYLKKYDIVPTLREEFKSIDIFRIKKRDYNINKVLDDREDI